MEIETRPQKKLKWEDPEAVKLFSSRLQEPGGFFWGRLGGSDFDAIARYYDASFTSQRFAGISSRIFRDRQRVRNLNGFFDLNKKTFGGNYLAYLEELNAANIITNGFMFANASLISHFQEPKTNFNSTFRYADTLAEKKDLVNYGIIEGIWPFLRSLKDWGAGKKILVVSPFSESIKFQHTRSGDLINGYEFPKFELLTYNTPITYNSAKDIRDKALKARTSNWNLELSLMKSEILSLDFDIALLSCGSYATPIGAAIQAQGKKAIYLGGVLNVFFNIFGARYDNRFVEQLSNPKTRIDPLESQEFAHLQGGRNLRNEALRAYLR